MQIHMAWNPHISRDIPFRCLVIQNHQRSIFKFRPVLSCPSAYPLGVPTPLHQTGFHNNVNVRVHSSVDMWVHISLKPKVFPNMLKVLGFEGTPKGTHNTPVDWKRTASTYDPPIWVSNLHSIQNAKLHHLKSFGFLGCIPLNHHPFVFFAVLAETKRQLQPT